MMDGSVIIQIAEDREKILNDLNSIMPAAFISFKTRWGAAFCAQTQQSRNQLCG
jgi:lysine-specific demethylase 3